MKGGSNGLRVTKIGLMHCLRLPLVSEAARFGKLIRSHMYSGCITHLAIDSSAPSLGRDAAMENHL